MALIQVGPSEAIITYFLLVPTLLLFKAQNHSFQLATTVYQGNIVANG